MLFLGFLFKLVKQLKRFFLVLFVLTFLTLSLNCSQTELDLKESAELSALSPNTDSSTVQSSDPANGPSNTGSPSLPSDNSTPNMPNYPTQEVSSVSRGGVTWRFEAVVKSGVYANGDPWVVGPVKIVSITPGASTQNGEQINGSMLNIDMSLNHGFDENIKDVGLEYTDSLNFAKKLPLSLKAGDTLMSSVRNLQFPKKEEVLQEIQVLTVVSVPPEPGAFRPPYVGRVGKEQWNEKNILYGKLKSLPKPNGGVNVPSLKLLESNFEFPWIYKYAGAGGLYFRAVRNHPLRDTGRAAYYGRELSHMAAEALLSLQLNYTNDEKRKLTISMVQIGIDVFGAIKYGKANFYADGGHNNGHKMPLLLAAVLLNDDEMLTYARGHTFQEDQQTFYVDQNTVNITNSSSWAPDTRSEVQPYKAADIGLPEWGIRHSTTPTADNKHIDAMYRHVSSPAMMGQALTAHIMGIEGQWNWPAFFDYADRYYSLQSGGASSGANSIQLFVRDMWEANNKP